ncbi:MAG TPA: hypothetical protein VF662_08845 [Allosphingosinicella sp.]|jgi:hypothetical protein
MFRIVSALFVALAMFLSPVMMAGGGGIAHAAPAAQAKGDGHCRGETAPEGKQKPDMKMSCASACAAFPAATPAMAERSVQPKPLAAAAEPLLLTGIAPERETPPPRPSPAI